MASLTAAAPSGSLTGVAVQARSRNAERRMSSLASSTSARPEALQCSFIGQSLPQPDGHRSTSRAVQRAAPQTSPIVARTATSRQIEVEVDKPLGLTLGQKSGGGVTVTAVQAGGNAAKAGLQVGDTVLYTSSFFGDELWPADKLSFTRTAINAKPDSVYFVVVRGPTDINVKKLPTRPAPSRFGKKLTPGQKERATHICLDCGYVYCLTKSFDAQPSTFECPQCRAPKSRFAEYDAETGRVSGGGKTPLGVIISAIFAVTGIAGLFYYLNL